MNVKGKQKRNQVVTVNIFEQQELVARAEAVKSNLIASTWHELETKGKFDKNAKTAHQQMHGNTTCRKYP